MIQINFALIFCVLSFSLITSSVSAQVEVTEYYESGNIHIKGNLDQNNLETGKWENFFENGSIQYIIYYQNGLLHGLVQEFYENGQLKYEEEYVKGVRNGIYKSYYPNGIVAVSGHYLNGKRTGVWKQYYENGQVGEEGNFDEGVFKGEGRFYYENGQLMKVFYSDSDKTIEYDENGNLVKAKRKNERKKK
jgi:uncharacterized protein